MKIFDKKLIPAAIAVAILLSGCHQQVDIDLTKDNTKDNNNTFAATLPDGEATNTEFASGSAVKLILSSVDMTCNEEYSARIINALKELKPIDLPEFTTYSDSMWSVSVDNKYFERYLSDMGYIIIDSNMRCYEDSPALSQAVTDSISDEKLNQAAKEEDYSYYTIDCSEPNTEEEYRKTAIACVDEWLTSLQSPDTEEYYRNKSFEITEADESGRTKCNYLSCGLVEGRKEFVVEICFTAEGYGDRNFYDQYYQEGRYTEAGTYWSGQYICGRFAWENGKCSLLRFADCDGSERIQIGLNGINQSEYKTFFDFARRSDLQQAIDESFVPYGLNVSRNLTQTEDGKAINIDIYTSHADSEDENTLTAIWSERAYINGESTYGTGLYFTDGGTGHMPDTLPKNFSLTFDNYDGDANPDFCVRYDNDENGTFYCLDSIQTDGRIFTLSGRAFEGGIYIAGCTDPSPRLQRTDYIPYIGWKYEGGRYYPTDEDGYEIQLPDLNMYSDRSYLPDSIKSYSEEENSVTCFLWNNTEYPVTTDVNYSIEYLEEGQWKKATENLPTEAVTINPREHGEITYDISSIKTRYNTYYRIVQNCSGMTAYGKFYSEGEKVSGFVYTADDIAIGQSQGKFIVDDCGLSLNESAFASASVKDGDVEYPLTIFYELCMFNDDGTTEYYYNGADLPQKAGTYPFLIDGNEVCSLTITDALPFPALFVEGKINKEDGEITIKAGKNVSLTDVNFLQKEGEGFVYSPLTLDIDDFYGDEGFGYLEANKSKSYKICNYMAEILDEDTVRELYESFKEDISNANDGGDYIKELMKKWEITADVDYEGFKAALEKYMEIDENSTYMVIISYRTEDSNYRKFFTF